MSTQGPSPLTSSSSSSRRYEVFLSFRVMDTGNNFTDHLYAALRHSGISTFRDNERLERGKFISSELMKTIEAARISIVILSKNYAFSTWCLDELAKIIQCEEVMGMSILPIFYNVDPSEVRNQSRTFAQAFAAHEERLKDNMEKVQTWRATLTKVTSFSGWHLNDSSEAEIIEDVVKHISNKLGRTLSMDSNELVGIASRVEKLMSHLAIESNGVRFIGIWGMGGMGKTTLAKVVYKMISNHFEACSFISNVKEVYEKYGILQLQQTLLKDLLTLREVNNDVDGAAMIYNRLRYKKILLVLDDVNELVQLDKLVVKHDRLGPGSRVIITTRDAQLLMSHKIDGIYEVEGLSNEEALLLFNRKAFHEEHPPEDYLELCQAFVDYADGLPLAIEVLGSNLCNKRTYEWKSELARLKEFPERKIMDLLQISFNGLNHMEREIFLHIACFLNYINQETIIAILDCLELYPKIGLSVLIDKSLIKYQDNQLWIPNLLQEMGRDIVRRECRNDQPERRSRLWLYEDIDNVLTNNTGTKEIQGIVLTLPELEQAHWDPRSFSKMPCLKFLIIGNIHLMCDLEHLPNDLRFLDWDGYTSKSLPASFQPNKLIELHMRYSNIERLWNGIKSCKMLKFIELKGSLNFLETPDVTKIPILEKLVLEDCTNLREIHPSIRFHKKLTLLNLKGCKSLISLPKKFEMESLKILILSECSKLERIPKFGENMELVTELYLDGTAITKLPTSIGNLTGLVSLNARDCKNLMSLPSISFNMKSLKDLNLSGCSKLENLGSLNFLQTPDVTGIPILEELVLEDCINLLEIHPSIRFHKKLILLNLKGCKSLISLPKKFEMESLEILILSECSKLERIPEFGENMELVTELYLDGTAITKLPTSIGNLTSLVSLNARDCKNLMSLPSIIFNMKSLKDLNLSGCSKLENLESDESVDMIGT